MWIHTRSSYVLPEDGLCLWLHSRTQLASRGTAAPLHCCGWQELPWYCGKPTLTSSHTELHLGWQCPQPGLGSGKHIPLFLPPHTAYTPDWCSYWQVSQYPWSKLLPAPLGFTERWLIIVKQTGQAHPLSHSKTTTWSLKHNFFYNQLLSHLWKIGKKQAIGPSGQSSISGVNATIAWQIMIFARKIIRLRANS